MTTRIVSRELAKKMVESLMSDNIPFSIDHHNPTQQVYVEVATSLRDYLNLAYNRATGIWKDVVAYYPHGIFQIIRNDGTQTTSMLLKHAQVHARMEFYTESSEPMYCYNHSDKKWDRIMEHASNQ
jgi:hypothetical protein